MANVATAITPRDAPLNVLLMARWRCCRCRMAGRSLVWCHPALSNQRDEVRAGPMRSFVMRCAAFGWRLGRITQAGKRSAYPLL